jgi:hypothetical protein
MKCIYRADSDNNNGVNEIDLNKIMDPEAIVSLDLSVSVKFVTEIVRNKRWNVMIRVDLVPNTTTMEAIITLYIRTDTTILDKIPMAQLYETMVSKLKQKFKTTKLKEGMILVYQEHNEVVSEINTLNNVTEPKIYTPPIINDVMLKPMINLQKLNLGDTTHITGEGIKDLVNLVEFNAGYNNFQGEDFAKLNKITVLKLRPLDPNSCNIAYKDLAHLPLKTLVMCRYAWLTFEESKFLGVTIKYWGIHLDA